MVALYGEIGVLLDCLDNREILLELREVRVAFMDRMGYDFPGIFRNGRGTPEHNTNEYSMNPMSAPDKDGTPEAGQARSDTAFVALLTGHQLLLRNFVASLIPAVDARADIVQEINILLWEKRSNFELDTNFKAWAFAVARYVVMNNQKRYRREGRLVFSSELVEALADQFEEMDPEPDERMGALRECLSRLPDGQQRLLLDCHTERGSIEKAALERGQPAVTIRSILLRLRNRLRNCVHERLAQARLAT